MQQLSCLRGLQPRAAARVRRSSSTSSTPLAAAQRRRQAAPLCGRRGRLPSCRAATTDDANYVAAGQEEEDLEDQLEKFMKRQAELESGGALRRMLHAAPWRMQSQA